MNKSRYHIIGQVGQGQFGQVFCASDRVTGQLVAMKKLEPLRFPTHRFLRELAVLVRLQHPNIVGLLGLEYTAAGRYLVIDYCQGGTLRHLMDSKLPLSLTQQLQIVQDILLGLEHIHHNHIIHCDLKPENILLKVVPQGWRAQIADFGIAHFQESTGHQDPSSGNTGSPAYMAPERFYGKYSPESDLYAVGVLLFEIVVGRRPFSGMPIDIMKAHLNQPLRIPRSLPSMLRLILNKALQKLPQNRYGSATSMRMMLEVVIANLAYSGPLLETFPDDDLLVEDAADLIDPPESPVRLPHSVPELSLRPTHLQHYATVEGLIHQLWLRPQGCFVATYQGNDCSLSLARPHESLPHESFQCVTQFLGLAKGFSAAKQTIDLDLQGKWFAVLASQDLPMEETAEFNESKELSSGRSLKIFKLQSLQAHTQPLESSGDQIWFSSSRHLLISPPSSNLADSSTLQLWNRRGQQYWTYIMPAPIRQAVQIGPDRMFAITDAAEPMGLWIDLLPFRIRQIPLNIQADWIGVTYWGYVLVSQSGALTYLNRRGRIMAKATLPIPPGASITAIATGAHSNLLWIGVQCTDQSELYTLDMSLHLPKTLLLL